jgi:single-strand DNA-binding protein
MAFLSSINEVMLLGNLGANPEITVTPSGKTVCNCSLATNETWKDREGKRVSHTEWHKIVAWGVIAELIGRHCRKGSKLLVKGKIRTRKWLDRDGIDRYDKEIVGLSVIIYYEDNSKEEPEIPNEEY